MSANINNAFNFADNFLSVQCKKLIKIDEKEEELVIFNNILCLLNDLNALQQIPPNVWQNLPWSLKHSFRDSFTFITDISIYSFQSWKLFYYVYLHDLRDVAATVSPLLKYCPMIHDTETAKPDFIRPR